MRMIDADTLKAIMPTIEDEYKYAHKLIDEAPTVDAEPVRHGYWIRWREDGLKRCKCSECLASYGNLDTPYCPNCGAKMDEEDDDETD